jgi:peptide/nickel transport system substrate-binding protein
MMRKTALAALVVTGALVLAACGQKANENPGSSTSAAASGSGSGTAAPAPSNISAVFSNIAETTTLDPAIAFSSDGLEFVRNVYDSLTMYEPGGVKPVPSLAESWTTSSDNKVWTFKLRTGVKFHSGGDFTSADVVATINRVQGINQGPATLIANISKVEAPDATTAVITLKDPDVFLLGKLQKIAIISAKTLEAKKTADDEWAKKYFADAEDGTGPYQLDSWQKASAINLKAFTGYYLPWDAKAPTSVTLRVDPDVQTALQLLQQGKIDMMGAVGPDDSASASKMNGVKLVEQDALGVQILPMNTSKGPLTDPKVREAVSLAFDYQAMIDYYKGYGTLAVGPLPTAFGGGLDTLPTPKRDVEKAKALLAEAGKSTGVTLTYLGLSGLSYEEFVGTLLQQNLKDIGIDLKIQMVPWPQMSQLYSKADTARDISFLNMSAVSDDPAAMLNQGYVTSSFGDKGGYNWSYWSNADVDKSVAALPGISDATERNKEVLDTVKMINDNYVAVYAAQPKLAQPVLAKWDVKYEIMDYNYVVRFFYARANA